MGTGDHVGTMFTVLYKSMKFLEHLFYKMFASWQFLFTEPGIGRGDHSGTILGMLYTFFYSYLLIFLVE